MKQLLAILFTLALITGCATLQPGADPLVVRSQQTEKVAFDTFDTFLKLEHRYADKVKKTVPEVSKFADWLREPVGDSPRGIAMVKSLGKVRKAYAAAKTPDNKAKLGSAVDALAAVLEETKQHLTAAQAASK